MKPGIGAPQRLRFRRLRLGHCGLLRWLPRGGLPAATSSTVRPDFTERGSSSSMSAPGRANASSALISSQLSRFSPGFGFSRTRSHSPCSLFALQLEAEMPLLQAPGRVELRRPCCLRPRRSPCPRRSRPRDDALEACRSRTGGPRHARPAAFRPDRGSAPASPPSSTARRHARA